MSGLFAGTEILDAVVAFPAMSAFLAGFFLAQTAHINFYRLCFIAKVQRRRLFPSRPVIIKGALLRFNLLGTCSTWITANNEPVVLTERRLSVLRVHRRYAEMVGGRE